MQRDVPGTSRAGPSVGKSLGRPWDVPRGTFRRDVPGTSRAGLSVGTSLESPFRWEVPESYCDFLHEIFRQMVSGMLLGLSFLDTPGENTGNVSKNFHSGLSDSVLN